MRNFIDFIENAAPALPAPDAKSPDAAEISEHLVRNGLAPAVAEKFAVSAISMVTSRDFFSELSGILGEPKANESRDDFIARGLKEAQEILEKRLRK